MTSWNLPRGYRYAGIHCGIRAAPERLDLALVVSDTPASAAGLFTQNRVVAAPVRVCQERLPRADGRGIVICSGNANACTGQRGRDDACRMAAVAAQAVGCAAEQMLVCSTAHPTAWAATAAMRQASSRPRCPVQALALPEQMTIPRPSARGSRSWHTRTGAATTRFCVKRPAADAGVSLTTKARSRRSGAARIPQWMPAYR